MRLLVKKTDKDMMFIQNVRVLGKNIVYKLIRKYRLSNRTRAFKRRYKNYKNELFKLNLDQSIKIKYKDKWKDYGERVEIDTFMLSYNLSGKSIIISCPKIFTLLL